MTSSNVSNLLIQVSQIDISTVSDKANLSKDKGLFMDTLKNVANAETSIKQPKANDDGVKLESKPESKPFEPSSKVANETSDNSNQKITDAIEEVDNTEVVEQIEKFGEEIKTVIEEELDISDEELIQVMENLGFTVIDLFNPQNLAQVVAEITEQNDSVSLLMDESFKNILDEVSALTNQLFEETGISFEELKSFMTPIVQPEEIDIPIEDVPKFEIPLDEQIPDEGKNNQVQTEVIKPEITEEVMPQQEKPIVQQVVKEITPENENTDEKASVELKPQVENENQSSKQEFDFSKNEKSQEEMLKLNRSHEPIIRHDGMIFAQPNNQLQFSVEQEVVTLPTGETVKADNIVNQLVEQARVLTDSESTTMEMTLNPEGLGKIFMEITQKGDAITAKIFTENDAVKQALENQMVMLKTQLNQNSTKITSIEVSVGTHEFERNLEQNAQDQNRREEQMREQSPKRSSRIDLGSLDELSGMMSEEDMLIAQMMRDNGNTLDFQA